ncbi:hypothetical protein [Phenylobacterium sp.]|jgi:hypothetical protein|uniref:hypothetical protein n=1 Tax=Phenylobacterium sp. TaxID=1871053 RepID=UPI002F3FF8D1
MAKNPESPLEPFKRARGWRRAAGPAVGISRKLGPNHVTRSGSPASAALSSLTLRQGAVAGALPHSALVDAKTPF